jgi:hypothetical protein
MFGDGQILFLWAFWCDVHHPSLILLCHFFFEREDTRACAYLYGGLFRCQTSELLDTFFLLLHISCFSSCAANSLVVNFHKKFSLNWIQAILTRWNLFVDLAAPAVNISCSWCFFVTSHDGFCCFPRGAVNVHGLVILHVLYVGLLFFLNYTTLALLEEKKITFVP